MNRADWGRVEALFAQALEQPPEQRAAYVAAAGVASHISGEVLALLDAHERHGPMDRIADRLHAIRPPPPVSVDALQARLHAVLGDRYRCVGELGRGGMAIVLLADDLKHQRKVALKVLQPELALSLGPTRFLQEITIAASLAHPHILPLHDSGDADGLLYYVMPYVEGETLRTRLKREGPLPLEDALRITFQLADALAYAHGRRVVHRDVKPENILLEAGHALIADFGIARAMTAAGGARPSDSGHVLGTPAYMSPEQARGAKIDGRTDIYSLGCVLFEMLAGGPPFIGKTADAVLRQHLTAAPPALASLRPGLPPAVDAAVRRALAKRPRDRFITAADFAAALPHPGAPLRSARWTARRIAAGAALAAVALGTAAVVAPGRSSVDPAAAVVAVLPLVPTAPGRDTALARLGRDLVVTLSANLDGIGDGGGEIRTVDALTVLAQTQESGPLALEPGARLAGLLGATSFLHGAIARTDSLVRVDLGVFRAAEGGREAIVRASATARPADVAALTDSLTWAVLRGLWRAARPPTPALGAVTTDSLAALQAFLEGEHAGLENRWSDAADAYGRAVRADSAFWLAYWRYAYARWWYLEAVDQNVLTPLRAHRAELPERDRLVFDSWWTDSFPSGVASARAATQRYPDYWPGWMQLADWLFHVGPVYGNELAEARKALERTVRLNPAFVPAWEHLFWAAVPQDTAAAARALTALERHGFGAAAVAEFGFDVTRVYRLDLHSARGSTANSGLLDSVARDLVQRARGRIGGGANLPQVQVALSRRVLRSPRAGAALARVHGRLLADAWAARGAWDSALAVAGQSLDGYRLAAVGGWLGAVPIEAASRPRIDPPPGGDPSESAMWQAELGWLDGILAVTERDREALAQARARVRAARAATSGLLDSALGAFDLELSGARRPAAHVLVGLNWERPDLLVPGYGVHPYVIAVNRLAAAAWFLAERDTAHALAQLAWFEALWALDGYRPARRVLAAHAALARARIAEAQGDLPRARREYEAFLRRYDAPVRAHRYMVAEARAALIRVGG